MLGACSGGVVEEGWCLWGGSSPVGEPGGGALAPYRLDTMTGKCPPTSGVGAVPRLSFRSSSTVKDEALGPRGRAGGAWGTPTGALGPGTPCSEDT